MRGVLVTADIHWQVGVSLETVRQNRMKLDEVDLSFPYVNIADLVHGDIQNIRLEIARGSGGSGQIHFDGLQLDHREAGHHERRQQEEHDVDQRDDFDTGLLVRKWRANLHAGGRGLKG